VRVPGIVRRLLHKRREEGMATIKDVEHVADDLESLVGELRKELKSEADFGKLVAIADQISEHADNAAQTFNSVNDALMSRLGEITGKKSSSSSSKSQATSS
jgi:hypothetical protein